MISRIKNLYSTRILALVLLIATLLSGTLIFVGTVLVPEKLKFDTSVHCVARIQDKAYHTKQLLLENVNNSKLWVQNPRTAFFDSKWFAISYYEHDTKEWVLKDYRINDIVLDVYKIAQSEYISVDQNLDAPSSMSEQFNLQKSKIGEIPVLVLDVPNSLVENPKNHLIRITLFADQLLTTLSSDDKCAMNLLDTKGNILTESTDGSGMNQKEFLNAFQDSRDTFQQTGVKLTALADHDVLSYKVLKNLYIVAIANSGSTVFTSSIVEISVFSFIVSLLIATICFSALWRQFLTRRSAINSNIVKVSKMDFQLRFDLSTNDELSSIEEEISRLADKLRKK